MYGYPPPPLNTQVPLSSVRHAQYQSTTRPSNIKATPHPHLPYQPQNVCGQATQANQQITNRQFLSSQSATTVTQQPTSFELQTRRDKQLSTRKKARVGRNASCETLSQKNSRLSNIKRIEGLIKVFKNEKTFSIEQKSLGFLTNRSFVVKNAIGDILFDVSDDSDCFEQQPLCCPPLFSCKTLTFNLKSVQKSNIASTSALRFEMPTKCFFYCNCNEICIFSIDGIYLGKVYEEVCAFYRTYCLLNSSNKTVARVYQSCETSYSCNSYSIKTMDDKSVGTIDKNCTYCMSNPAYTLKLNDNFTLLCKSKRRGRKKHSRHFRRRKRRRRQLHCKRGCSRIGDMSPKRTMIDTSQHQFGCSMSPTSASQHHFVGDSCCRAKSVDTRINLSCESDVDVIDNNDDDDVDNEDDEDDDDDEDEVEEPDSEEFGYYYEDDEFEGKNHTSISDKDISSAQLKALLLSTVFLIELGRGHSMTNRLCDIAKLILLIGFVIGILLSIAYLHNIFFAWLCKVFSPNRRYHKFITD